MAKNDSVDFGEIELDDLDFDSLDFGSPFEQESPAKKSGAREAITEFTSSAAGALKDRLLDRGTIRRLVSGGLHKGYTQAFNAYDAIESGLGDVLKDNANELNSTLLTMKRKTDRWSPIAKRLLPKFLRDAMEDADSPSSSASYNNENSELNINLGNLDKMFAAQIKDQADRKIDTAIRDNRDQKRFLAETETQLNIGRGIGRLVGYQDTITINYHRKSLEIGYRQLDIAARMLQLQTTHFAGAENRLDAILKNTGLPDFIKMQHSEVLKQTIANKLASNAMNTVGNWASNFFGGVKQNASEMLSGVLQFRDSIEQQTQFGRSRAEAFGGSLGAMAGSLAGNSAEQGLHYLVEKLKPILSKIPGFDSTGEDLRSMFTSIPQKVNTWAKTETQSEGVMNWVEEGLKSLFDTYTATGSISGLPMEKLDQAASFDNLFYKSVTEIMPAYMASMEKWLRVIATGQDQEEMAWSHYAGGMVSRSTLNEQHVRTALKNNTGKAMRQEMDALVRDAGGENLSKEAMSALRMRFMKDLAGGNSFEPEKYSGIDSWSDIDQNTADELINFFSVRFNRDDEYSTPERIVADKKRLNDFIEKFEAVQRRMPAYGDRMNILQKVVGRRAWRELGLSKYNGMEGDNIDLEAVYRMVLDNDSEEFDPAEKVPKDKKELKKYLDRKRKAQEELLRYGIGNNDKVDVDANIGSTTYRPDIREVDEIKNRIKLDMSDAFANIPKSFEANVKFPELMKTSDELTQEKLTEIAGLLTGNNDFLDQILQTIPLAGSSVEQPTPSEGTPGDEDEETAPRRGLGNRLLRGLGWLGKKAAKGTAWYLKKSYSLMGKGVVAGFKTANWARKAPFEPINGLGVTDIYLAGQPDEPVMYARDIRRGFYIDVKTNEVIKYLKDITGAVRDVRTNLIVLTEEDFVAGLYSGEGESLAGYLGRKAMGLAGMVARGSTWYFGKTYGLLWKATKKITELAYDQFIQFDAYFPGEEEPRITSKKLKRGFYRDEQGAPIMSLKDIKGAVYDIDGNLVISLEEMRQYKSLYTRNGSLLFTFGRGVVNLGGKALELAGKGAKWYMKKVGQFYKGAWEATKWTGRTALGLVTGKGFGNTGSSAADGDCNCEHDDACCDPEIYEKTFEIHGRQLDTQLKMLKILEDNFAGSNVKGDTDGDGVRDWSWSDILRRRKEKQEGKAAAAVGDNADVVAALEKLGDRLDVKMEELIETTEEAGETGWLEDASDLANLRDGMGGGGADGKEGRRRKGRKGKMPRTKRGLMRRAGGAVATGASKLWNAPWLRTGATWAGSALLSGGTALLSGAGSLLGGAATLIGGALSMPVVAAAAAVGVIAYAGYRYYKANKAKDFPLMYLRMAQYGIDATNEKRVAALLEVEKQAASSVRVADGKATMDGRDINMNALAEKFELDSPEKLQKFAKWVAQRFRPVFLAHSTAMHQVHGHTNLAEADKGIGDGDLEAFLKTAMPDGMNAVYDDVETSPFDGELDFDNDGVQDALKNVYDRRRMAKLSGKAADVKDKVATAAQVAAGTTAGAVGFTMNNSNVAKFSVGQGGSDDPRRLQEGLKLAGGGVVGGAFATFWSKVNSTSKMTTLNIPTAVRYKTYGLVELEMTKCVQLQQVEEIYWDNVIYSGTSKASFAGDEEKLKQKVMDIFKPATDLEKEEVSRWLEYRFIPTFLQYCISVRRRYNGDARDGWRNMTGTLMKEVLDETTRAEVETMFRSRSVWEVQNSPWPGYQLEKLSGSTRLYIDSLDTGDDSKVLNVDGMTVQQRTQASNTNFGTRLSNVALGNTKSGPVGPGVGYNHSTFGNYAKIYSGQQDAGGAVGQSSAGYGTGSILYNGKFGSAVQHPGGGTGGDINSLPNNTGDGAAEMGPIIQGAAKMVGFDPTIAMNVAAVESGLKPNASSGIAHGLFQFIGSTWQQTLRKYGPTYGIAPNTPPTDPRANAILGVCYLKENYEGLSKSLGQEVTDLDLYMAHFLGLGGARRFLTAPRQEPAYAHVGNGGDTPSKGKGGNQVTGNNMSIFYKDYKSARPTPRNVGEVLAEMDRRMNIGRKIAGNPVSATPTQVASSSVPAGATPTETPSANGGSAMATAGSGSGPASPTGAAPVMENAASAQIPTGMPGAQPSPSINPTSVAAQAGAGASPSVPIPMAMPTSTSVPAPAATASAAVTSGPVAPPPTPVSPPVGPTQAAVMAAAESQAKTATVDMATTNEILDKQLVIQTQQRDLLVEIREILRQPTSQQVPGTPQQQTPRVATAPHQEPTPRNPVSNKRGSAVT